MLFVCCKWFRTSHWDFATPFQDGFWIINNIFDNRRNIPVIQVQMYHRATYHLSFSTIFALLTYILGKKITEHNIFRNNILALTQNKCKSDGRGTKELFLIDTAISQQLRWNRKNITTAFI